MRTLRLSLVGTVTLVLVGGTGATALAQADTSGETGAMSEVEGGHVEQVTSGPGGEFVHDWPAGSNGLLSRSEKVEASLRVVGDGEATLFEFAAIPQGAGSDLVEPAE